MSIDSQLRQRGKEERNSELLVEGESGAPEQVAMAVPRKERYQGEERTGQKSDPALQIKSGEHGSQQALHFQTNTPILKTGRCLPSRPRAQPTGTPTRPTCRPKLPSPERPHDLQPEQLANGPSWRTPPSADQLRPVCRSVPRLRQGCEGRHPSCAAGPDGSGPWIRWCCQPWAGAARKTTW